MRHRASIAIAAAATVFAVAFNVRAILLPVSVVDSEIRDLLVDHVDRQHESTGTVVGIVTPKARQIFAYGRATDRDARALDGDTVFEIGSVTKIFTALALADMAARGEVGLDDPVNRYLPAGVAVPDRNGRPVTLTDLATHTSGLPFFPTDIPLTSPADAARMLAAYPVDRVHRFVSTYVPRSDGRRSWAYSNLGYGLLGEALARRGGIDYEALIRARVIDPLGLTSTTITLSAALRSRLADGHDERLHAAPPVDMPAFEAAGCLRSTANDLLTFLEAFMGRRSSRLAPAMAAMLATRRPGPGVEQALGWWVVKLGADDPGFVTFAGQTPGFAATVAYDPPTGVGVVVLSNGTADDGGLAWHVLRPDFPVRTAAVVRAEAARLSHEPAVAAALLDAYAGDYRVASGPTAGEVITIEHRGADLILESSSTPPGGIRLHAIDDETFFVLGGGVRISFESGAPGRPSLLVFHLAGIETPARRLESGGGVR